MICQPSKNSLCGVLLLLLVFSFKLSAQNRTSNTSSDSLRVSFSDTINILNGKQPFSHVLQSTATVFTRQLITTPSPTFLIALQGRLAGANILQTSGLLGRDGSGIPSSYIPIALFLKSHFNSSLVAYNLPHLIFC